MTITLKIDDKVREALKQAFPTSDTERALDKYVGVLEELIFKALQHGRTPEQCKFNLYSLSTHHLAQRGGYVKQVRLHKWLGENGWALVEPVITGSNISGQLSQCKLTAWVILHNALNLPTGGALENMTDRDIDILLGEPEDEQAQLIPLIYPDIDELDTREKINERFHVVEVDIESLKSYIVWLSTESTHYNASKKEAALRQARIILAIAQFFDGKFLQRKKPSPFGRLYYEGISVQSVNKDLRRAMLGNCWSYDIRSSVIAWKMGFAKECLQSIDPHADVRKLFSATLGYLEDKPDFMATVRHYTFKSDSHSQPDLQKKIIKRALTAISFGARMSTKGWLDDDGQIHNPALVDIIKNAEERDRFFNCPSMRAFIHEQKLLDDYLYGLAKASAPELLKLPYLQTHSGRPSKAKVLAYLYQHAETEVMAIVQRIINESRKKILAHIHDAVIVRHKLGIDLKHEIELQMQEQTGNPYWRLACEPLNRFESRGKDSKLEERDHRQRIREEEADVQQWVRAGQFRGTHFWLSIPNR